MGHGRVRFGAGPTARRPALAGGALVLSWDERERKEPRCRESGPQGVELIDELRRNCPELRIEIVEVVGRFLPFTTWSAWPKHPLLVRLYLRLRPPAVWSDTMKSRDRRV